MSTRTIYCQKLQKQAEGLIRQPYANELGKRIYETISKEAWQLWLKRQTMFINENRLDVRDQTAKEFLKIEMEKFLFDNKDNKPLGYVPTTKDHK